MGELFAVVAAAGAGAGVPGLWGEKRDDALGEEAELRNYRHHWLACDDVILIGSGFRYRRYNYFPLIYFYEIPF